MDCSECIRSKLGDCSNRKIINMRIKVGCRIGVSNMNQARKKEALEFRGSKLGASNDASRGYNAVTKYSVQVRANCKS